MRNLINTLALVVGVSASIDAQPIRYSRVVWPERIAVGMRQGDQISPFTVEATPTGWVSIDFLSTRPDEGIKPPPMRMMAEARDVKTWVTRARRLLDAPGESAGARGTVTLGRGAYALEILRQRGPDGTLLSARACGPGYMTWSPNVAELLDFLALLDSASTTAGGGQAPAPTLSRPYYASEVSCPVKASADNETLIAPSDLSRSVPDLGVQFVVDTAGRVERGSIRFLPDGDAALARRARAVIEHWRFRRAEIDGAPVRQIVQTTVGYAPAVASSLTANDLTIVVEPTDDGWVHFSRRWISRGDVLHQWFEPDSVDAWLAHMWGRDDEGRRAVNDTARLLEMKGQLGPSTGPSIASFIVRTRRALTLSIGFNGCYGSFEESGRRLGDGSIFATAAAEARKRRTPPADPTAFVHSEQDVACPAWLEWTRSTRKGFERVWSYPVASYPESMRATHARADVLVSFVVDTIGSVEPSTVVVMPDSDPRAVGAIPATIKALKYRPATRSGSKVRQRVIQILRFEPPPTCATLDAGPACQR